MFFIKKILFITIFFISLNVSANQFSSISPSSLNVAKTDEIANFLNNKKIEGIYSDSSNFIEIFQSNGNFQFEMLSGQYKGLYRGKWKTEDNKICFLYDGTNQFDCVFLYYANDNNGNLQVFFGTPDEIFSQITSVNDINPANSLTNNSNQRTTPNAAAPEGTEHISDVDIVRVGANYLNYPSDNELSELNFEIGSSYSLLGAYNLICPLIKLPRLSSGVISCSATKLSSASPEYKSANACNPLSERSSVFPKISCSEKLASSTQLQRCTIPSRTTGTCSMINPPIFFALASGGFMMVISSINRCISANIGN